MARQESAVNRGLPGGDRLFHTVNYLILTIVLLAVLYPLYFVLIASISDPAELYAGRVVFFPRKISFEGFVTLFEDDTILRGYWNSIVITIVGTSISVYLTLTAAFALTYKHLYGKNIVMGLIAFTMFFNGGIIPTYLVVRDIGLLNTIWALVIPNAVWAWNLFIARTFYASSIPSDLQEAATIDGASMTVYFYRIVLPLSKAIIAVMVLYYGVALWNLFFQALLYMDDEEKFPLQLILRNILIENDSIEIADLDADTVAKRQRIADLLKYTSIVAASLPMLMIYPFLQRFFMQGVMIGSIKG
jgi:putative aldouronate transport system permease protein